MVKRGSQTMTFILAFLAWMLLSWNLEIGNLIAGVVLSLFAMSLFGELLTVTPGRFLEPARYLAFIEYIPVFLWEMVKANLDVAYRVLHPAMPINPGLIKLKTGLHSDVSKAFLGNSLSLTPGNTTIDIKGEDIYVHCIDIDRHLPETAAKYEKFIARIFE